MISAKLSGEAFDKARPTLGNGTAKSIKADPRQAYPGKGDEEAAKLSCCPHAVALPRFKAQMLPMAFQPSIAVVTNGAAKCIGRNIVASHRSP